MAVYKSYKYAQKRPNSKISVLRVTDLKILYWVGTHTVIKKNLGKHIIIDQLGHLPILVRIHSVAVM